MEQFKSARREFLGKVAKAGMIGLVPVSFRKASAQTVATRAGIKFLTSPYLQQVTATSAVIMWITDHPASSWVEYGESAPEHKALPEEDFGLIAANTTLHKVKIEGLQPGTRYTYRITSKQIADFQPYKMGWGDTIQSEVFHFTTANPKADEVSWLVLNDIHDRPASFAHLLKMNGNDPYDFVFLNGDMFDFQTDEQQIIDHLIAPLTSIFATEKPFLLARGNHETRGKYAREFTSYFANPGNQYYFQFTMGPVHFIVLDTGEDKEDDHAAYSDIVAFDAYRKRQAVWLEKAVKDPAFLKAKYRVVIQHIPVFHSGEWHGTVHCRELFNPIFNKAGIDLMICGHTHKYGVHPADPATHNYPIVIGGGPKEGLRTLIKVKADKRSLVLQMLGDDGVEVGRQELKPRK